MNEHHQSPDLNGIRVRVHQSPDPNGIRVRVRNRDTEGGRRGSQGAPETLEVVSRRPSTVGGGTKATAQHGQSQDQEQGNRQAQPHEDEVRMGRLN
jgi:hypothetical protein